MPGTNHIFDRSFSGNYPLVLAKKLQFRAIKNLLWGRWAGFTTPGGVPVRSGTIPAPVDSPVVIHNELNKRAGDLIEVPMLRNVVNLPRIGKEQMKEFEEEMKVNFAQIPVELMRHAVKPQESTIDTQVNKDLQLLKNAYPALERHYARAMNYLLCGFAMYYGYSWNVLASARWSGDSKVSAHSHPHIYVAGSGKVSYASGYPGTSNYETQIGTNLGTVASGDVFDTSFLQALKADQQVQRINPLIMKDGTELRLLIAHPYQIKDLENDAVFREVQSRAMVQQYAKENPYLVGAKYVWAGFAIFENDTVAWPVRVNSGVPEWGPATVQISTKTGNLDSFDSYSSDTLFAGLILGSNALAIANADRMEFKKRVDDYDELVGIAYRHIPGAARADFWNRDDGSTGQYIINDSSAVFVTYAAAPTSW